MTVGQAVFTAFALYVATGLLVGVAFVSSGVTHVMPASFTVGARVLLLPASIALWPYVLIRWIRARGAK